MCITREDAGAYTAWLSKKTGKDYRLPSEAEWEYVARAGSRTRLVAATTEKQLCAYANVQDTTRARHLGEREWMAPNCSDGYVFTAPVGSFAPNSWGVYDMLGNASELVEDCFHESYRGAPRDGSAWTENCTKAVFFSGAVIRGGSFCSIYQNVRPAFRDHPARTATDRGFRVMRSLEP